jgi:hypothetical protein
VDVKKHLVLHNCCDWQRIAIAISKFASVGSLRDRHRLPPHKGKAASRGTAGRSPESLKRRRMSTPVEPEEQTVERTQFSEPKFEPRAATCALKVSQRRFPASGIAARAQSGTQRPFCCAVAFVLPAPRDAFTLPCQQRRGY